MSSDLNADMMKAKVPPWFQKISGWEGRLLAMKADISLIFGVKPDTNDGVACLEAVQQVILDFLANITARPDRKINKGLMTAVETELEQAKLTISYLRDTQMRQETILQQYAEESSYYKDAVIRRDAGFGLQRSQLLTEIVHLKQEVMRLQAAGQPRNSSGGGGGVSGGNGTATIMPVMSREEKRAAMQLQQEIRDLRKETERLLGQVSDLEEKNWGLTEQLQQVSAQMIQEISQKDVELVEANKRMEELDSLLSDAIIRADINEAKVSSSAHNPEHIAQMQSKLPTCKTCAVDITEPLCRRCLEATATLSPHAPSAPTRAPAEALPTRTPVGPKTGALSMLQASIGTALKRFGTAKRISLSEPEPVPGNSSAHAQVIEMSSPRTPTGKKRWSFENDIEAWKTHCDSLVAKEKEACKAKLDAKEADIAELLHASLEGRKEFYEQFAEVEHNFWEPQLIEANLKLAHVTLAYTHMCEDVKEDLEDLAFFIAVRKLSWEKENNEMSTKVKQFTSFIENQMKTVKSLRKEKRSFKEEASSQILELEAERLRVVSERMRYESELVDLRQNLLVSGTKIKRLEFRISQLEGSEFRDHTHQQADRLRIIRTFDRSNLKERRDLLLKKGGPFAGRPAQLVINNAAQALAIKQPIETNLRMLRDVFGLESIDADQVGGEPVEIQGSEEQSKKTVKRSLSRTSSAQNSPRGGNSPLAGLRESLASLGSTDSDTIIKYRFEISRLRKELRAMKERNSYQGRTESGATSPFSRTSSGDSRSAFSRTGSIDKKASAFARTTFSDKPPGLKKSGSFTCFDRTLSSPRSVARSSSRNMDTEKVDDRHLDLARYDEPLRNVETQTPASWRHEGGGEVEGTPQVRGDMSRDALMASILPSMNLMVVPMKSAKGATSLQPPVKAAKEMPVHLLREMQQRNMLHMLEGETSPDGHRSAPAAIVRDRAPIQGRGFSHTVASFSIEFVREPKPPPDKLSVKGAKSERSPRANFRKVRRHTVPAGQQERSEDDC